MFITHFSFASATLFTIPYVCMHERSYRIFFYCNLHLKMMSCKRLSIDWLCYSTLYKISIFSKASIFFLYFVLCSIFLIQLNRAGACMSWYQQQMSSDHVLLAYCALAAQDFRVFIYMKRLTRTSTFTAFVHAHRLLRFCR